MEINIILFLLEIATIDMFDEATPLSKKKKFEI